MPGRSGEGQLSISSSVITIPALESSIMNSSLSPGNCGSSGK